MTPQSPLHPDPDRGENELSSKSPPVAKGISPQPVYVGTLDYERRKNNSNFWDLPVALQFFLGLISVYACLVPIIFAFVVGSWVALLAVTFVILYVVFAGAILKRANWTGFFPGLLCGIFLLPLVGFFLCCIIISNI